MTVLFIIWVLFEIVFVMGRRGRVVHMNLNNLAVLAGFIYFVLLAVVLEYLQIGFFKEDIVRAAVTGKIVFLSGLILRVTAFITLGMGFRPVVSSAKNETVVQRGVYRFIRHPSYTGMILIYLGISLCLLNWVLLLVSAAGFISLYIRRVHLEEKVLVSRFGKEYSDYQKKTRKFIPYVY
jgi:protein-S-isoprenylcysteine O-methyltransferase Ste14